MNKKALSLAITLAMAFPTASHALGLGDIQSNSHLNQPFRGKIPVLSASPSEVKSIRVRIASPEVFNRVGIDRPAFLNSIRFRPTIENGRPVILVSSSQPIREPFVNFLLEVNWSKGQLLKEYTALLDPPVLMQPGTAIASNRAGVRPEPGYDVGYNRPAARQQARRQQQQRIVRAPARRPAIRRAAPNRQVAAAPARSRTYRVRAGDTLFKVAKKLGYRGIRTEQMMMALFEANPQAFHRHNVNILKKGALMKRPPIQHAKSITYRAAKRQLALQTKAWKRYRTELAAKRSGKPAHVASNNQSARSQALDNAAKGSDYQFKVSGSKGGVVTDSKVSGNASVAELKKQLALASESLASRTNENAELKSRVTELESLLRKKNRLISIKSEQLSELQARLGGGKAANTTAKTETPTTIVEPTDEGAEIAGIVDDQSANNGGQVVRPAPVDAAPAENVTPSEPEQPESAPAAPVTVASDGEDEGILGMLADPTLIAGGLGAGGLLLGGLWFMKRRKEKQDFSDEDLDNFDLDMDGESATASGHDSDFGSQLNADLNTADAKTDEFTTADFGEDKMFADSAAKTVDSDMLPEGESKEENILQEADVYLVYGLHDQAESELRKAIDEEPDNLAYRAKLIENFKAAGDKEAFEKEARIFSEMEGADKDKHWAKIAEWGKTLLPESSLFSGEMPSASKQESSQAGTEDNKAGVAGLAAGAAAATAAGLAVSAGKASPDLEADASQFSEDLDNVFDNDGLEDLNLDAVLSDETDGIGSGLENAQDEFITDIESTAEASTDAENADDLDLASFDLDNDMEFTSDVKQDENADTDVADNNLEMTNLNLDVDANDFDKLMPEDHAYKKSDTGQADGEENLLADFDDNLSFLDLEDKGEVIEETQISTKLDLAKAYMDMGDIEGARNTLEEVMLEGNDEQKRQAEEMLQQTG